jgi:hypothetical protein
VLGLATLVSGSIFAAGAASASTATPHVAHAQLAIGSCAKGAITQVNTSKVVTFPYSSYEVGSGPIKNSSPTVITVASATGAPDTVVVFGDEDGYVHVVDASTCAELPGWPKAMQAPAGQHASIETAPTVAYLDGPGKPPSIIVGSGSTWTGTNVGEIEAFNWNGSKRFLMRVPRTATNNVGIFSTPAVGPVAGPNQEDIVFGSWDDYLYVLNPHGKVLAAYDNKETIWSSPALYMIPGRQVDDIYVGNDRTQPGQCVGGYISDFYLVKRAKSFTDHDFPAINDFPLYYDQNPNATFTFSYTLMQRWTHCQSVWTAQKQGQSVWSSPAVVVIPGIGPVVFVGTSWYETPFGRLTSDLFAYRAVNGAPLPGWPVATTGPVFGSPAVGDITGSGDSIVDTAFVCTAPLASDTIKNCMGKTSEVFAVSPSGHILWQDSLLGPTDLGSPIIVPLQAHPADLNQGDVLVGSGDGLFPIDGATGHFLYGTSDTEPAEAINPGCQIFNAPAAGDVEGTGPFTGWYAFETCNGPRGDGLYAYALPVQPATGTTAAWPMFHQNPQHTGGLLPESAAALDAGPVPT